MFPAVCISRAISKPIEGNFYLGSDEHLHFFADFCVRIDGVGNLHKGVAGFGGGRNRKAGGGHIFDLQTYIQSYLYRFTPKSTFV